jgi:hypothetical protein
MTATSEGPKPTLASRIAGLIALTLFGSIAVAVVCGIIALVNDGIHTAASVRAAMSGDCRAAYAEAYKAAHISEDAKRFCPNLKGNGY